MKINSLKKKTNQLCCTLMMCQYNIMEYFSALKGMKSAYTFIKFQTKLGTQYQS